MTEPPPRSGSIPPPGGAVGAFSASVEDTNDRLKPEVGSASAPVRSAGSPLVSLVGLYFLAGGAYALYVLILSSDQLSNGAWAMSWLIGAAFAAASLYAAVRILQFDERGRSIGLLLAFIGLVYGLFLLSISVTGLTLGFMAADAFILWVLFTTQDLVRR